MFEECSLLVLFDPKVFYENSALEAISLGDNV